MLLLGPMPTTKNPRQRDCIWHCPALPSGSSHDGGHDMMVGDINNFPNSKAHIIPLPRFVGCLPFPVLVF